MFSLRRTWTGRKVGVGALQGLPLVHSLCHPGHQEAAAPWRTPGASISTGRVLCLSWHPSGTHLAAGSIDFIRVLDVHSGNELPRRGASLFGAAFRGSLGFPLSWGTISSHKSMLWDECLAPPQLPAWESCSVQDTGKGRSEEPEVIPLSPCLEQPFPTSGRTAQRIMVNCHVPKSKKRECVVWSIAFLSSGTVISSDSFGRVQFWDWERGTLQDSHTVSSSAALSLAVSEVRSPWARTAVPAPRWYPSLCPVSHSSLFLPERGQHCGGHLGGGHLPVPAAAGEGRRPGEALGEDEAVPTSHPRRASCGAHPDSSHLWRCGL